MFKLKCNKKNDIHEMETGRIISAETDFNTVETYKAIRTNIMFSLPKKEYGKVICVTSSAPGEGKTTTCTNLAITFAQTGAKVALVDCDLRKARMHRYLEIKRDEGVSNILCGFSEIENTLIKNVRENLDVLTAGEIPLNPAELLQTQEFDNLIDKLRKEYDYVFIDTPPITVVTDAVIVSKLCDGIVIVIRVDHTTFDMLDETAETLEKSGKPILGAIMLGGGSKAKKYGYYKSGKYKYKHGYKYGYKYNYHYGDDVETEGKLGNK